MGVKYRCEIKQHGYHNTPDCPRCHFRYVGKPFSFSWTRLLAPALTVVLMVASGYACFLLMRYLFG